MGLKGCATSGWTALKRLMAKRVRAASGAAGWALLFLSSGRVPPPPPDSQIEVSDRICPPRWSAQQSLGVMFRNRVNIPKRALSKVRDTDLDWYLARISNW
jgi:hypothetical protein